MKRVLKDIGISCFLSFIMMYLMYLIKGGIMISDLSVQGVDFLQYFKNEFSFLNSDYIYNWHIALGDNAYALMIYYLLSPFNIILLFFKNIEMGNLIPLFLSFKMVFLAYFSSLYFRKILSNKYRWLGTLIYLSSYNIMQYGNYQIMWLDTFIFLPLVLLGIERILRGEGKYFYIFALFIFVVSDYYYAILLVPHIAVYGILRYRFINGSSKGIMKFIKKMLLISSIGMLLSAFVLIPAIDVMLFSGKESGNLQSFGISIKSLLGVFTRNYVGVNNDLSNTYITLVGMIVVIPFIALTKNRKYRVYLIHIIILFGGLLFTKLNYILNFNYCPAGADYRYNLFLNIYISIFLCKCIDELREKGHKKLTLGIIIMGLLSIVLFLFSNGVLPRNVYIINTVFILTYTFLIIWKKIGKKMLIFLLCILLTTELGVNTYYIYKDRNTEDNGRREAYQYILNYIDDKYNDNGRIEVLHSYKAYNMYISSGVNGVSGYHSLMSKSYKEIGNILSTTNDRNVVNQIKGRNIIASLAGTRYYVTGYNYCPYFNSRLIDRVNGYYIFQLDNKYIKYFPEDALVKGSLPNEIIEKDVMLYRNLHVEDKHINAREYVIPETNTKNQFDLKVGDNYITKDGEYYIRAINSNEVLNDIKFSVNENPVYTWEPFKNINDEHAKYEDIYIGHLEDGDILTLNESFGKGAKLVCIPSEYIQKAMNNMNSVNITYLNRNSKGLETHFSIDKGGYVFFPVVYDKNWRVKCNGEDIKPIVVDGGFMAFKLDKGKYNLQMKYVPSSLYIGLVISLLTLIILLLVNRNKIIEFKKRITVKNKEIKKKKVKK